MNQIKNPKFIKMNKYQKDLEFLHQVYYDNLGKESKRDSLSEETDIFSYSSTNTIIAEQLFKDFYFYGRDLHYEFDGWYCGKNVSESWSE